ncbi:MAG: hypothetical protein K2G58_04920 [Alistipes sp.]|nr:hypothetical protein [Alistipes sp.]
MKNFFKMMLLCAVTSVVFSACSDEDDRVITLTPSMVVGTWDVTYAELDGQSADVPVGYIYMILKEDGSYRTVLFSDYYVGTYKLQGDMVVGTTPDPITEYYRFTRLEGARAEIDYSNSAGVKIKFKAVKRS